MQRWCAWDSNLGPHDCRCRRIHRAMVAPQNNWAHLNERTQNLKRSFIFSFRTFVLVHPSSYFYSGKIPLQLVGTKRT